MVSIDYQIIGTRIREIRSKKKWSQAKLAEKSGVEPSYVSHIERGVAKLSLPTLISIANALGSTLDELVYDNLKKSAYISDEIINELLSDCTNEEKKIFVEIIKFSKNLLRKKGI